MTGSEERKLTYRAVTLKRYATQDEVPFEDANALLIEHGTLMHARMVGGGGPSFDIMLHINGFWAKFDQVLPPVGSFYLAWGHDDQLLGTGALRTVSPGVGEMKHLYVRPEARGMGLGRALVEARIADARAMGLKTLLADTFAANSEMPALYDQMGFERVAPFDVGGTAGISPYLAAHMLFFRKSI
ncbi:MAG: GNAT family N-acetyltransferase [Pseudomonadota bacterium]